MPKTQFLVPHRAVAIGYEVVGLIVACLPRKSGLFWCNITNMHVAVACIITMHACKYGNTDATPAVDGCHGNIIFISDHILKRCRETEYDEV